MFCPALRVMKLIRVGRFGRWETPANGLCSELSYSLGFRAVPIESGTFAAQDNGGRRSAERGSARRCIGGGSRVGHERDAAGSASAS